MGCEVDEEVWQAGSVGLVDETTERGSGGGVGVDVFDE